MISTIHLSLSPTKGSPESSESGVSSSQVQIELRYHQLWKPPIEPTAVFAASGRESRAGNKENELIS